MYTPEFFVIYFIARIVIPFGALLLLGEVLRRRAMNVR